MGLCDSRESRTGARPWHRRGCVPPQTAGSLRGSPVGACAVCAFLSEGRREAALLRIRDCLPLTPQPCRGGLSSPPFPASVPEMPLWASLWVSRRILTYYNLVCVSWSHCLCRKAGWPSSCSVADRASPGLGSGGRDWRGEEILISCAPTRLYPFSMERRHPGSQTGIKQVL